MRAELKLPYLDAFTAALAREQKAELATADSDFVVLEPKRKILWLD
jgi:predicted nucleic acid-binding protein